MSPATRAPIPPSHVPYVCLRIRPGVLAAAAAVTEIRGLPKLTAQLRAAERQAWEQQPDSKEIETWAIT